MRVTFPVSRWENRETEQLLLRGRLQTRPSKCLFSSYPYPEEEAQLSQDTQPLRTVDGSYQGKGYGTLGVPVFSDLVMYLTRDHELPSPIPGL